MKKFAVLVVCLVLLMSVAKKMEAQSFDNPGKFNTEIMFGLRLPLGEVRNDIMSGFTIRGGIGYQLTKNWELLHVGFDFGNSTPHDPEWITIYDPYSYSTTLQQETVNVYGFPVLTRFRFQIHDQLEVFVGAGGAYYWFRTRLDHPYYGELKKSRKRHGPGGLVEAGIFTDAFSDNLLVGFMMNFMALKTDGETLTTPDVENEEELNEKVSRKDMFFSINIILRYYLGNE